jgi:hypothetical protein
MTKTALLLPLGLIAAAAVGLMGLFSFEEGAQAGTNYADVAIGSATVAPNGTVTVDLTVTPSAAVGAAESGANCGDTTDNDADTVVDDGCPLGAIDATVGYTAADLSVTGCTANFGGACNALLNPVTYSIANLSGISGVAGTLTIQAGATEVASTLTLTVTTCGDQAGGTVTCGATNGTITIAQATATPTTAPTPTPTTGAGTPTPTTGAGTATPTRSPTPAGLPPTGGSDGSSSSLPWLLAVMGIAGAAAAGWATMKVRRIKA